ncbi:MAG: polysaccharide biosynthesis protein, partial [Rhodospirillaceae bacterium]
MPIVHKIQSRGWIVFGHDIVMAALSFAISVYLRLDFWIIEYYRETWLAAAALFTVIAASVFWLSGLYRGVWRYASLNDLWAITRAVSLTVLIFAFVMFLWLRLESLPRSVLVIEWFVLMALLGGPRFLYRLVKDRRFNLDAGQAASGAVPVLLVGAGDGAELFLRALRQGSEANYRAVGILAENTGRVGREIHGVQVIDSVGNLANAVAQLKAKGMAPRRLILTKDDMDGARVRQLFDAAGGLGLTLARLPKLTDFKAGLADKLEIKPVDVEDLMGRPQVPLDRDAMARLVNGRRVLVTGAGGSIGAELVRQIAALKPAALTLLDNSEYALYRIDLEVSESFPGLKRESRIADVRDAGRLADVFAGAKPDIVFHAAALKHVPMVEQNVIEGIATNTLGTVNVTDACLEHGVGHMVVISTDKAVNPSSVMGASKRLAEIYCQARDIEAAAKGAGTRFVTVRFGNV